MPYVPPTTLIVTCSLTASRHVTSASNRLVGWWPGSMQNVWSASAARDAHRLASSHTTATKFLNRFMVFPLKWRALLALTPDGGRSEHSGCVRVWHDVGIAAMGRSYRLERPRLPR